LIYWYEQGKKAAPPALPPAKGPPPPAKLGGAAIVEERKAAALAANVGPAPAKTIAASPDGNAIQTFDRQVVDSPALARAAAASAKTAAVTAAPVVPQAVVGAKKATPMPEFTADASEGGTLDEEDEDPTDNLNLSDSDDDDAGIILASFMSIIS
jgi:hypothetical protein